MPEADLKLLRDEAEKRGKEPSTLAREILSECLHGPGVASVGRGAAKKSVVQRERKPAKPVIQATSTSDRLRQMRDSQ